MGRKGFLAVLFLSLTSLAAQACPACNIFNYLYSSINSSKNIFIGELVSDDAQMHGTARVLRVVKGEYSPDAVVNVTTRYSPEIGKTYIFSDPTLGGPDFPMLDWDPLLEDECRFLVRLPQSEWMPSQDASSNQEIASIERRLRRRSDLIKRSMGEFVKDADEAVVLAQGTSNLSRLCGFSYIRQHPAETDTKLRDAIAKAKERASVPEASWMERYRLGNLAEALLLQPTPKGESLARQEVEAFLKASPEVMDFTKESACYRSTARAYYTLSLIRFAPSKLNRDIKRLLLEGYPRLRGLQLAEATNVLCELGYKPANLQSRLTAGEGLDYFALGVGWIALERANAWDFRTAMKLYDVANPAAQNADLKRFLDSQREWAKKSSDGRGGRFQSSRTGWFWEYVACYGSPCLYLFLFVCVPAFLAGRFWPVWARFAPLVLLAGFVLPAVLNEQIWPSLAIVLTYLVFLVGGLFMRARKERRSILSLRPYDAAMAILAGIAAFAWYCKIMAE